METLPRHDVVFGDCGACQEPVEGLAGTYIVPMMCFRKQAQGYLSYYESYSYYRPRQLP